MSDERAIITQNIGGYLRAMAEHLRDSPAPLTQRDSDTWAERLEIAADEISRLQAALAAAEKRERDTFARFMDSSEELTGITERRDIAEASVAVLVEAAHAIAMGYAAKCEHDSAGKKAAAFEGPSPMRDVRSRCRQPTKGGS